MSEITSPILLDSTGQEIITSLDKIASAINSIGKEVYGFIEHMGVRAPGKRIEYTDKNAAYNSVLTVDKTNHTYSLGDWANFPILKENKPYMVKPDGTPDYRLDEEDYTKKLDGTASDVDNASYSGGAFSWLKCVYKYEKRNGNDRIVKFAFEPLPGFEPVGFLNKDGRVLAGRWIPMFYGTVVNGVAKCIASGNCVTAGNKTTDAQHNAIVAFDANANFLGGPIMETIIDLLIMFAKTTDLQGAYGNGNMSGYVNDSSQNYGTKDNAVVGGGQFYGSTDGKSLNKILHSIVLGTYQQWMRDPYEVVVSGRVKVSKDYTYDPTGALYTDTGIDTPNISSGWKYPLIYISAEGYGSVPDVSSEQGSTALGPCDGTYTSASQSTFTAVLLRFGSCTHGATDGPRARSWGDTAAAAHWILGFALLLDGPVAA